MSDRIEIMASAGHGEYGDLASRLVRVIWEPTCDDLMDQIDGDEEVAQRLWRESYGDLAYPPADLTWETIIGIAGTRAEVGAWLDSIISEISVTPHGDDEVFDYWPSGVRLAREVAAVLGREDEVTQAVRDAIDGTDYDADELGV